MPNYDFSEYLELDNMFQIEVTPQTTNHQSQLVQLEPQETKSKNKKIQKVSKANYNLKSQKNIQSKSKSKIQVTRESKSFRESKDLNFSTESSSQNSKFFYNLKIIFCYSL